MAEFNFSKVPPYVKVRSLRLRRVQGALMRNGWRFLNQVRDGKDPYSPVVWLWHPLVKAGTGAYTPIPGQHVTAKLDISTNQILFHARGPRDTRIHIDVYALYNEAVETAPQVVEMLQKAGLHLVLR